MWTSDDDDDELDPERFVEQIDELLDDPEGTWSFARDTLEGIKETVERTGNVTDGQLTAVENIRDGGRRRQSRDRGRW